MTTVAGAATDTGLLRESNEDRYWMDAERGVFLVVDGVGGRAAGELAAQTAVETIREAMVWTEATAEERVRAAITAANNRIFRRAQADQEHRGMACVLTLALVEDGHITIGHVGDSRLYLIWDGAIRKLTSDHSPVGEDEDAGALTEEEAMLHPRRNEVFRDVGSCLRDVDDSGFIEIRCGAAFVTMRRSCCAATDSPTISRPRASAPSRNATTVTPVRSPRNSSRPPMRPADGIISPLCSWPVRDFAVAMAPPGPKRLSATTAYAWCPVRGASVDAWRFLTYGVLIGMLLWAVLRK